MGECCGMNRSRRGSGEDGERMIKRKKKEERVAGSTKGIKTLELEIHFLDKS